MAYLFAPEFGVPFTLTGPNGAVAVFNDQTSPNYVGSLSNITGLESPEVREAGEDLPMFDGGVFGQQYYGRRPIVIEGIVAGHGSATQRNQRLQKLMAATDAMRADATLTWTPSGGDPLMMKVRRHQRLSVSGGWAKTFQVPMIAADPRIYSAVENEDVMRSGTSRSITTNLGTAVSYPTIQLGGDFLTTPFNVRLVENGVTDTAKFIVTRQIGYNKIMEIDTLNRGVFLRDRATASINYFSDPSLENAATTPLMILGQGSSLTFVSQPSPSSGYGSLVARLAAVNTNPNVTASLLRGADSTLNLRFPTNLGVNLQVKVSFSYMTTAAGRRPRMDFTWRDTSNALISTVPMVGDTDATPNVWNRQTFTVTGPSLSALRASISIGANRPTGGNFPSGEVVYLDGVTVEVANNTTVSTGAVNVPGVTPNTIWAGTPYQSVVWLMADYPSGARTPWLGAIDYANSKWGGLSPSPSTMSLVVDGATVDNTVGQQILVKSRHAWL